MRIGARSAGSDKVGIGFERGGDFPIKLPENFCGAFGFLCYIHALSNGVSLGRPYEANAGFSVALHGWTDCDNEEEDHQKGAGQTGR